jgi:hypothetical protein
MHTVAQTSQLIEELRLLRLAHDWEGLDAVLLDMLRRYSKADVSIMLNLSGYGRHDDTR